MTGAFTLDDCRVQILHWRDLGAQTGHNTYLVIDGSWQPDVTQTVRQVENGWEPLFGLPNVPKSEAHGRAPLLVDLGRREDALDAWIIEGFKERLGVVVFSPLPIEQMRTSLKRFQFMMIPSQDSPAYFRFYDGRVLDCFLRTGFPAQWQDFFTGIATLAAPTDVSEGWTLYRMKNGALQIGITETPQDPAVWTEIPPGTDPDDAYLAADPYRRIAEPQFGQLMACVERGFHIEITNFIRRAFPMLPDSAHSESVLEQVAESDRIARELGYDSEQAIYYWAVLSFLLSPGFQENPEIKAHLAQSHLDIETKLEDLLDALNMDLQSPELTDLIDTNEVHLEYADGEKVAVRTRSGRPVPNVL